MAFSSRNNKTNKRKKVTPLEQVGEGYFSGLDYAVKESDIYDKSESVRQNPDVTFKDDKVILDYGHLLESVTDAKKIKLFFQSTVESGEDKTITITKGEYLNEQVDSDIHDIGGIYTVEDFDEDTFIVILTVISVNNRSSTYDKYERNYFINGSLRWTSTNTTDETKTEEINEIINRLGWKSTNSFFHKFKSIKPNDIIEIKTDKVNIDLYTVIKYYRDDIGVEHVTVKENVPSDKNIFGIKTFCRLKRNIEKQQTLESKRTPKKTSSPKENRPVGPDPSNPRPSSRPSSMKNSINNKLSMTSVKPASDSMLNKSLNSWRETGKKVFNVEVSVVGGWPKFVINGVASPILSMSRGVTYKFLQTHASNKKSGTEHILTFTGVSPENIVRSHASPGTRDSYVYLTVPNINRTGSSLQISYTCQNNTATGNTISIDDLADNAVSKCPKGYHWMPSVGQKEAFCMPDVDMHSSSSGSSSSGSSKSTTNTSSRLGSGY